MSSTKRAVKAVVGAMGLVVDAALLVSAIFNIMCGSDAGMGAAISFATTLSCLLTALRDLYDRQSSRRKQIALAYIVDCILVIVFLIGLGCQSVYVQNDIVVKAFLVLSGLLLTPYFRFIAVDFLDTLEEEDEKPGGSGQADDGQPGSDASQSLETTMKPTLEDVANSTETINDSLERVLSAGEEVKYA